MPLETIKMLSNLHTAEVSLVRRGANRKRYAITKSEEYHMPFNPKVLEAVLKTAAEGEDKLIATLKAAGADEKRIDAAVAQFRVQKGFADVVTAEDAELIAQATGVAKKDETDPDEPDDDDMPALLKKKAKKTKKSAEPDLSQLAPETRAQVEAVFKSNEALVGQVESLTGMVKTLVDNGAKSEYVAKAAKEFSHIPGTPDEIGIVLKSAHDASPELGAGIEKLLGMVNGLVRKSALLGSVGSTGGAGAGGSAWERIQTLATGLTMKAGDKDMTPEQKIAYVTEKTAEGRALYKEYLGENPAQRAKYNF